MQNCSQISNTSFIGGSIQATGSYSMTFDRCAFSDDVTFSVTNTASLTTNDCVVGQMSINSDGRPVQGANAGIDMLDADTLPVGFPSGGDLSGGQRVYNGKMDIGCLECDWRPTYSADIDGRHFAVTSATPNAVHGANGVLLPAGGALDGVWTWSGLNNMQMNVSVTGGGTLTVSRNGEAVATVTAADGPTEVKATPSSATDSWSFAYAATGDEDGTGAWIGQASFLSCMTIIIR